MIQGKCRSDDYNVEIEFDATAWFEQASEADIIKLAECQWGGDYPADAVSEFFSDQETSRIFDYVSNHPAKLSNNAVGHETYVDSDQAVRWLEENRPEIAKAIEGWNLPPVTTGL